MRGVSMKLFLSLSLSAIALVVLTPIALSCVVPRTLDEQMYLAGDEVVVGRVVGIEERWVKDQGGESVPWTLVNFRVEESYLTGAKEYDVSFYFRGGVRPGTPAASITPSSEDVREGRRLLVFLARRALGERLFGPGVFQVDSYAEVYRVLDYKDTTGVERQVVLGKGSGFAFPNNEFLSDARAHVALASARKQQGK